MKVKIVQRKNPQKPDEPGKFYGQPVLDGVVGMDMICRQIAGRSSVRPRVTVAINFPPYRLTPCLH